MKTIESHVIVPFVFVIALLFTFDIALGQGRLDITFRPAANFPVKNLGEVKLDNGGGFEVTVAYGFMQHLALYGGWGWSKFSEKESTVSLNNDYKETGYTFGLQFNHPFSRESKLNFIFTGGGIYNHIVTKDNNGDIIGDTDHGLGWQAEMALSIPVGHHNRWYLMPSVRFRELSSNITEGGIKTNVDLHYISTGLGVSWRVIGE